MSCAEEGARCAWLAPALWRPRAAPGHPRREVGSVPKGLAAHAHPLRGWQGSWPGCFHRPPPVPTFTKASQTVSSSWGKTWPHTMRWMASSCRGCTESVGEYSPMLGPPACPTPSGQSLEEGGLGVYLWCLASMAFWHWPCAGCRCVNSCQRVHTHTLPALLRFHTQ